jgi:hypothetical protein
MSSTSTTISPTARWLTHLRRETERFADVVRTSPLRAHVPAYPDFTVHSLAAHIGRGLRLFHAIAVGGGEQPALEVPPRWTRSRLTNWCPSRTTAVTGRSG